VVLDQVILLTDAFIFLADAVILALNAGKGFNGTGGHRRRELIIFFPFL